MGGSSPSGEALGARGAGRFFAFGLLVGVMPYQGWRGLAAVSFCSCSGVLFWVVALSSSSSSSSSKGLYDLGSVASDLLSSLPAFPTSSPSSSSEVLLRVSWLLPGGGGGAGFFLGSACTKAIHGGSLALTAALGKEIKVAGSRDKLGRQGTGEGLSPRGKGWIEKDVSHAEAAPSSKGGPSLPQTQCLVLCRQTYGKLREARKLAHRAQRFGF